MEAGDSPEEVVEADRRAGELPEHLVPGPLLSSILTLPSALEPQRCDRGAELEPVRHRDRGRDLDDVAGTEGLQPFRLCLPDVRQRAALVKPRHEPRELTLRRLLEIGLRAPRERPRLAAADAETDPGDAAADVRTDLALGRLVRRDLLHPEEALVDPGQQLLRQRRVQIQELSRAASRL